MKLLAMIAGIGAVIHVIFAYQETIGWGRKFVEKAAGAWIDPNDPHGTDAHIGWAKNLAFNIGIYNLVLAIGLAWTALSDINIRGSLGIFFSVWLLGAAAAAAYTRVYAACVVQGILGLLLLFAAIQAS